MRDFRFAKGSRFIPQPELNLIGTAAALIGIGIAGAVGSVASAAIGSRAAGNAAQVQADASTQAAQIQAAAADRALAFQREQWTTAQGQIAPWLGIGTSAATNLASLMGLPYTPRGGTPGAPAGAAPVSGGVGPTGNRIPPGGFPMEGAAPISGEGFRPGSRNPKMALEALQDPTENIDVAPGVPPGMVGDAPLDMGGEGPGVGVPPVPGTPGADPLINPNLGAFGSLSTPWSEQFTAPTDVTMQNDPGYAFRLKEGQRLLENSAASRGGLLTGSTAQDIQRYGQEYASGEYGNVYDRAMREYQQRYNISEQQRAGTFNRFAALSGMGQTAAGQLAAGGADASRNATNILLSSGNAQAQGINNAAAARASGYVGGANAWTGAIGGGTRTLQDLLAMQYYGRP